jgi:hypothetical protein
MINYQTIFTFELITAPHLSASSPVGHIFSG